MKTAKHLKGLQIRASGNEDGVTDIPSVLGLFSEQVEINAAEPNSKELPKITMLAYTGAAIRQIWSYDPVVINLSGIELPKNPNDVPIFANHDVNQGVGHATKLSNDNKAGIRLEGVASRQTAIRDEIVNSSANGFPWKASIGCGDLRAKFIDKGETLVANGREFPGPVVYVIGCKLKEVSFVALAADPSTEAIAAADAEKEQIMKTLMSMRGIKIAASGEDGNKSNTPGGQSPAVTATGTEGSEPQPPASVPPQVTAADPANDMRVKAAAEVERITALGKIASGEILAKAIKEGWTVEKAELETIRAARPAGINIVIGGGADNSPEVLAAAVCQTCGLGDVEKHFKEQALEAADKQFRRSIGLNQLLLISAAANGYTGSPYFRDASSLRQAIKASFSTNTLSSVLSNVANKFIIQAFASVEQEWRKICKIRTDVQDFREYETYSRLSQLRLQKLAPDGRIKHGTVGDEKYTNQIDTYAVMLGIPRQAFINDDIGILSSISADFGQGAGDSLNELFWEEFLSNSTFFTAARGNLTTGANAAMSEDALKAAFTKFEGYTKTFAKEEKAIGIPAKYLLTGPALRFTAREWMNGATKVYGGDTPKISSNSLAGLAEPIVSRYITSAVDYYLLADPSRRPVMEVGFLRGRTKPTVEEIEPDNDQLGVAMRAYWDFGCKKQIPEAGLKVHGAA